MEKFFVVSREYATSDPGKEFYSECFVADDESEAWQYVEECVATQMSSDWLLSFSEARALYKLLGEALESNSELISLKDTEEYISWKFDEEGE